MDSRGQRLLGLSLVILLMITTLASPAYARGTDEDKRPPYDVPGLEHKRIWVPWVFAFLFTAACLVAAFKNPRRISGERT